jgi:hypothetical protein
MEIHEGKKGKHNNLASGSKDNLGQSRKKRLTVAQVKRFKGLEDISDDEAEAGIAALESLSVLFFELFQRNKK